MARTSPRRFTALCLRLGACSATRRWYDSLVEAHHSPPRAYHHLGHVDSCLDALDELRGEADRPEVVELALWFHDAIYDPQRRDNEARSAALARRAASEMGLALTLSGSVEALILVTEHRRAPESADERVILDADLTILGASPDEYQRYEAAIREEYAFVDEAAFCTGRAAILARFLEQERLYHTDCFYDRLEARARRNLMAAISGLLDKA